MSKTCERATKLLLIDGNNLAHRVAWSHKELSFQGTPVAVQFGFLKSLIAMRKKFPGHFVVVVWDGGHKRRDIESAKGVQAGIIETAYKANRPKGDDIPAEVQSVHEQMDIVREETLPLVQILQVTMDGYEADDVIYTYVMQNRDVGGTSVVVTSDKDYYQLLAHDVILYDAMKDERWTREKFVEEFGFGPEMWVDVGALMGDNGDNIHGVPGVGQVTACNYIREYGNYEAVLAGLKEKAKRGKRDDAVLAHEKRIELAYSLKAMDMVDFPPRLRYPHKYSKKPLEEYFLHYRFISILKEIPRLIGELG